MKRFPKASAPRAAGPPVTVRNPKQVREIPAPARTNLVWFEERCTGCSTCAQACP